MELRRTETLQSGMKLEWILKLLLSLRIHLSLLCQQRCWSYPEGCPCIHKLGLSPSMCALYCLVCRFVRVNPNMHICISQGVLEWKLRECRFSSCIVRHLLLLLQSRFWFGVFALSWLFCMLCCLQCGCFHPRHGFIARQHGQAIKCCVFPSIAASAGKPRHVLIISLSSQETNAHPLCD